MREVVFTENGVGAEPIGSGHRPMRFTAGRVCAEAGCATLLSVYNGDRFCALHGARPVTEHRRRTRISLPAAAAERRIA
ncbi:MAG: hypothetical protein ACYCU7_15585 [Acidimicrobiales bacterium]